MKKMGIEALYRKPGLSKANSDRKVYPYLLRGLEISRANQVWAADIMYIPMAKWFCYLVAIMDWTNRRVLSWRLSNTLDTLFCTEALEEALEKFGNPEIFNTDQGSQFTGVKFSYMFELPFKCFYCKLLGRKDNVINKPLIIGVAGGTGSGKTTVVQAIVNTLNQQDVVTIQHDSYYRDRSDLSPLARGSINFDHPDALETTLLLQHLKKLVAGQEVEVPVYDFDSHTRKKNGTFVSPVKVIIIEGILLFTEQILLDLMDIKIFVDTDDDIRFIRRLQRDMKERGRNMESVIQQYMGTVRPMHIEFVEPSRKYADIIIPEGHNPVAIDMVVSMVKHKFKLSSELYGK